MSNVKKNFAYQSVYQILAIVLPLITAPYISRVLGSENAGIYSYTNTIAYYFVVFAMLGLEQYGNRCIAQARDNKELLDSVFSELIIVHLLSAGLIAAIYFGYVKLFSGEYRVYALLQGMYVLSALFDINWFFFGIEKFKLTVTRNIVIKILTVGFIFFFVHNKTDLWKYCAIMAGSYLINSIILWRFLPRYVRFKKVSIKSCLKHLKPLLTLFVAVIASHIYRMIDKTMLGWSGKMSDLGCYEYADRIIRIPLSLITALGTVMLSRMSNLYARKETKQAEKIIDSSAVFVIFMSFALSFGLAAIAPEFVVIFLGEEYTESIVLVELLAVTIPFVAWNNFIRTQMLIPLGKDSVYTKAVTAGAIINVILNIGLINIFSARGAAIATIASYVVVMLIQTMSMIRESKVTSYLRYVPFFTLFGVLMYITVRIIGNLIGVTVFSVICEIVIGATIYCVLSLVYLHLTKKELIQPLVNRVFKK